MPHSVSHARTSSALMASQKDSQVIVSTGRFLRKSNLSRLDKSHAQVVLVAAPKPTPIHWQAYLLEDTFFVELYRCTSDAAHFACPFLVVEAQGCSVQKVFG